MTALTTILKEPQGLSRNGAALAYAVGGVLGAVAWRDAGRPPAFGAHRQTGRGWRLAVALLVAVVVLGAYQMRAPLHVA